MSRSIKSTLELFLETVACHSEQIRQLQSRLAAAQASAGQLLDEMEADRTRLIELVQAAHIPVIAGSIEAASPVEALPGQTAAHTLEQVPVAIEPAAPVTEEFCVLEENCGASASVLSALCFTHDTDIVALTKEEPAEIGTSEEVRISEEFCTSQLAVIGQNGAAALANDRQQEIPAAVIATIAEIAAYVSEDKPKSDTRWAAESVGASNKTGNEAVSTAVAETPTDLIAQAKATALATATAADNKLETAIATDLLQSMPVASVEEIGETKHVPIDTGTASGDASALPRVDNAIALSACRTPHHTHLKQRAVAAVVAFLLIVSGSTVMYTPLHAEIGSQLWKIIGCSAPDLAADSACSMLPPPRL